MKTYKKIIALSLALIFIFLSVACGNKGSNDAIDNVDNSENLDDGTITYYCYYINDGYVFKETEDNDLETSCTEKIVYKCTPEGYVLKRKDYPKDVTGNFYLDRTIQSTYDDQNRRIYSYFVWDSKNTKRHTSNTISEYEYDGENCTLNVFNEDISNTYLYSKTEYYGYTIMNVPNGPILTQSISTSGGFITTYYNEDGSINTVYDYRK